MDSALVVVLVVIAVVLVVVSRGVRVVPQATARVVERFGRFQRVLEPGLNLVVPFVDQLRPSLDLREQVVTFPPQQVITKDNLVVGIDTVIYFQVTDPKAATYEIANYLQAIEQLSVTTLRNAVGNLALEEALTSRETVNSQLGVVLDEATGKWGIKVGRVEIKAIEPPASIRDSMEKSMRADREKRATILTAEGEKAARILEAEGHAQAAVTAARGDAESAKLRAEGEASAIVTVNNALHEANLDDKLLAYKYLDRLPVIANGQATKVWFVPTDLTSIATTLAKGLSGKE
ncbi:MAG TPA: SPFH domain-containing protein [Mycobacteriales bacterium]|nr:SPFH domain-containing protein [Mycobacteriales bacterium]